MITHTIWTTQEDTVLLVIETGTVVNVQFFDQTFRGTPSSSVKARKNVQEERKNVIYVQAGSVSGVRTEWENNNNNNKDNALVRVQYFKKCRWWGSGNGVIITKQYKEAGLGEKGVGEVSP